MDKIDSPHGKFVVLGVKMSDAHIHTHTHTHRGKTEE